MDKLIESGEIGNENEERGKGSLEWREGTRGEEKSGERAIEWRERRQRQNERERARESGGKGSAVVGRQRVERRGERDKETG